MTCTHGKLHSDICVDCGAIPASAALAAEKARADAAERARDEVGIQLAAAQAEIARLRRVVDEARKCDDACALSDGFHAALRALDTVPGDALAKVEKPRFVAGCDVFTDEEHKARAVTTWAARGDGPLWFVEDTATDSMCLVGGESMSRRIAALLNGVHDMRMVIPEHDALRAEVETMRRCLADVCHVVLTDDAVTDTLWIDDTTTVADRIAQVLKIDTVAPFGGPSEALDALRARKAGG